MGANFIDETKIIVKAGDGGDGAVSFRREKFIEFGGPDGGNGGKGGDVILRGNQMLNTLLDHRYKRHFIASNGKNGRGSNCSGASGDDLYIDLPLGTEVYSEFGGNFICDIMTDKQEVIIASGGAGGAGNINFKTSINQAPRKAKPGRKTEEMGLLLKLKVLSNVGLIGLPNAGKSTFLSSITSARPKIAPYPFTTLQPHLGVAYCGHKELVIADIPGLIEGASDGIGLGDRFLKHIERCQILLHVIDVEEDVEKSYKSVRHELETFNHDLLVKPSVVLLNKIDTVSDDVIKAKRHALANYVDEENLFCCSSAIPHSLENVVQRLFALYYAVTS